MELNSYQTDANRTLIKEPDSDHTRSESNARVNRLGLAGDLAKSPLD